MRPFEPQLLRLAVGIRGLLAVSVAAGMVSVLLTIGQAVLLGRILAEVIIDGLDLSAVADSLVLLGVVVLCRAMTAVGSEYLLSRSAAGVGRRLRVRMVEQSAALGRAHRADHKSADLATLAGPGVDAVENYLSGYLPQLILAVGVPVSVLAYLFSSDLTSFLIVAGTLPLIPLFMALIGWYTQRQTRAKWRTLSTLSNHFADVVAGMPTLKAFGRAKFQAQQVRQVTDEYRSATMVTLRVAFLSSLVLELLATLSVALVAVAVGLRLVSGNLTLEVGLTVLILAPEAYLPLRALGAKFHSAADGVEAAGQIVRYLGIATPQPGARTDVAMHPALVLDGLTVGYGDVDVLGPVALQLKPGRTLVVTGASGTGKSTLLLAIAGLLRPTGGQIAATGLDGGLIDLAAVESRCWRQKVAYAGQRPFLVAGSIRDNLVFGRATLPGTALDTAELDVLLWRALTAADAAHWVRELPDGWHTQLADRGVGLSAGQRQRLCLARTLASPAPIVLLDEPTGSLDSLSEQRVLAGIREMTEGKTVVLVTHREAPLADADDLLQLKPQPRANAELIGAGR